MEWVENIEWVAMYDYVTYKNVIMKAVILHAN